VQRNSILGVVFVGIWAILCGGNVVAGDWPQWRGPARDGVLGDFAAPKVWPKQLEQLWKIDVGIGFSSPVVSGDTVFVFTREDENEVVRAVSLSQGKELWSKHYAAPYEMSSYAHSVGKGPKSTPVVAGGRLVTFGISGILSCWETTSGKLLWQHNFTDEFPATSPLYGTGMSPLVDRGHVIAHVGGHDKGALRAFDLDTGRTVWQWTGDGPAYTSPVVATLGDTRQLITQSQDACIGVSPDDGALLWKLPYKTQYEQNIVTPLVLGDMVIFSGMSKGVTAYRFGHADQKWSPEQVWQNDEVSMYMSSPVAVGGRLFGLSQRKKGQLFCLDAASGKTLWTSDGRLGDNASLCVGGDVILALTTNAELIAFRVDADHFEPLARYKTGDTASWATPVIFDRKVLIKDQSSLILRTL
jgi:outer membrane protein assembly factor BamB